MSSFVWMRVLESSAARYDRGVRWLSGGRIDRAYRAVAEAATGPEVGGQGPGGAPQGTRAPRVLDVGCGTGGVSVACAARGAEVVGIDRNAGMLEIGRAKALPPSAGRVTWLELGAMEIEDRFAPASFDAVVACLAFSEMAPEEQAYVLGAARTLLVPGGRLVDQMIDGLAIRIVVAAKKDHCRAVHLRRRAARPCPVLQALPADRENQNDEDRQPPVETFQLHDLPFRDRQSRDCTLYRAPALAAGEENSPGARSCT